MNENGLYNGKPEMSNEEYRQKLAEIFDGISNNIVLGYFYSYCSMLASEWNFPSEKR